MARHLVGRFWLAGLSVAAAFMIVWPAFAQATQVPLQITPPEAVSSEEPEAFTPFWVQTFTPTTAWTSGQDDAQPLGKIQMWRYLQVVGPSDLNRLQTVDPRTGARFFVDGTAVGPVGPPPDDYFAATPEDMEPIGLPGRIVGTTELFERPQNQRFFALEEVTSNTPVSVQAAVDTDDGRWYHLGDDQYVPTNRVRIPSPPGRTFPGRWIDANLTEPVMVTAYEGDQAIYSALAVKGTNPFQTPQGVFRVLRRVANETMDSATIGIPRASAGGYYLKDVLFTQYFTGDGAALHYNYWRSNWGYTGSHGCLGMNYDDSKFFWDFGGVGTVVYSHN
jgi:hypothetical protein